MEEHTDNILNDSPAPIPEISLLVAIVYRSVLDYLNDTNLDYTREARRTAKHWFWPPL
jgi:hypothetical protein